MTIDFEAIEKDGTFTLRDRDTLKQKRINEDQLLALLDEQAGCRAFLCQTAPRLVIAYP